MVEKQWKLPHPKRNSKDAEGRAQRNGSLQNSHERWTAQHFGRCVPRWPYAIQARCAKTLCDLSCTCSGLRSTSQYTCIQESLVRCSTFQDWKNTHAAEVEIADTSDTSSFRLEHERVDWKVPNLLCCCDAGDGKRFLKCFNQANCKFAMQLHMRFACPIQNRCYHNVHSIHNVHFPSATKRMKK